MRHGDDYRMARSHQQRLQADAGGRRRSRVVSVGLFGGAALALMILGVILLSGCALPAAPAVAKAAVEEARRPIGQPVGQLATTAVDDSGYLAQALAHIPAGARRFAFTHWARVHASNGFAGNSQVTSRDERVAYMLGVMNHSQAAAQLDSTHFLFQAQNWGWDKRSGRK